MRILVAFVFVSYRIVTDVINLLSVCELPSKAYFQYSDKRINRCSAIIQTKSIN